MSSRDYIGGLGAGKGWNKFFFFIDDHELTEVLKKFEISLVVTNRRTPVGYSETSFGEYIESYQNYLNSFRHSEKIDWKLEDPLYTSITADRGLIWQVPCPDERYILNRASEPLIGLTPTSITYLPSYEKLSVDMVGQGDETTVFGLRLEYPKVVFLSSEGYVVGHPTENFGNFSLFTGLCDEIKRITRSCVICRANRQYRTRIRISDECKKFANSNFMLKKYDLKVK